MQNVEKKLHKKHHKIPTVVWKYWGNKDADADTLNPNRVRGVEAARAKLDVEVAKAGE